MWPPVTPTILAGWVCVCLAAVSAFPEVKLYKKVGDDVVLEPGSPSETITSIIWKAGLNIAVQWDGVDVDRYRQFGDRGHLNISSGELTITGLTRSDSELYTAEINTEVASRTRLIVISPVPTPTVIAACDEEKTSCNLTCDGDTTDAEPVYYKWKSGDVLLTDPSKERRITTEDSSGVNEFSCELENPISRESSQPVPNPLATTRGSEPPGNPNISTGVTVFICLLAAVLLLGFIHRWKAGMWFFQKASMPWEADFWRRGERPQRPAGGSNGAAAAHPEKGQTEEETPMT